MIKKITKVFFAISIVAFAGSSLSAKSSIILGAGLQFDLGQLGGTMLKDGLDSTQPTTDSKSSLLKTNYKPQRMFPAVR